MNPLILVAGAGGIYLYFVYESLHRFKVLFENCNLKKGEMLPEFREKKKTSYGYSLRFSLPVGLSTEDFSRHQTAIEQYLNHKIRIKYHSKNVIIEVYEKELETEYAFTPIKTRGILEFPVGYSFGGKVERVDLAENGPHMIIAGETGSGKSTVLRSIITNLMLTNANIKLHLIDLKKGAEFNIFRKCGIVESFSRDREEAEKTLYKISKEVDRRYNLFFENDVVDIKEYNQKSKGKKLNYQLVIIDEFADLQNEKGSISIVEELAAKARACGIHLIVSTQRPDAKILNGRIKANMPVVLGLKTMNELNSRIIIDSQGLELLRGKGHGILKCGKEIEIQSMNIRPHEARDLLKHTYIEKKEATFTPKEKAGEVKSFDFLKVIK